MRSKLLPNINNIYKFNVQNKYIGEIMKMNLKILILLGTLILLFVPNVKAYSNMDFNLYPEKTSGCPCSAIGGDVDPIIENLDDVTHTYTFKLEMPNGWTGFIGTSQGRGELTLAPGERSKVGDITLYLTPNCFVEPGTYYVNVIATSDYGEKISKKLEVDVLRCHYVSIYADSKSICKGDAVDYNIEIENLGRLRETFDITVSVPWAKITKTSVTLNPEERKPITVTVIPPKDLIGVQKIDIEAKSQNSYAKDQKTVELNIYNCYDFSMDVIRSDVYGLEDNKVCVDQTSVYTLIINNTGSKNDTYIISTNVDWVRPEKDKINVAGYKSKLLNLFVEPKSLGKHDFEIKIKSTNYPELTKTLKVSVDSIECRGVSVSISQAERSICQSLLAKYEITVKNTGRLTDTYNITTDFGSLSKNELTIEPNEVETIELNVDTNEMEPETEKNITITVTDGKITDYVKTKLFAKNCYSAIIELEPETQTACQCDMINYTIIVRNTGEFSDEYSLSIGNSKISENFLLKPNESKSFYQEPYYVYYSPNKTYYVPVKLTSKHTSLEKNVTLIVEPKDVCYNATIEVGNGKKVKTCESNTIPIKIRNSGRKEDVYFIKMTAPDWVNINIDKIQLKSGEEKTIYLYLSPPYNAELGRYIVKLNVTSYNFGREITIPVEVVTNETEISNVTSEEVAIEEIPPLPKNETKVPTGVVLGTTKFVILGLITLVIIGILLIRFVFFFK